MLNIFGEIAYFTEISESLLNYGILVNASVEGIFGSVMKAKLFTASGEMKIVECADKIRVDGTRLNADEAYDALVAAGTVLDPASARETIFHGGSIIVNPCVIEDVIDVANRYNVPIFSGTFSATEVFDAMRKGANNG